MRDVECQKVVYLRQNLITMKKSLLFLVVAMMLMPTMFAQTKDNVARECVLLTLTDFEK